MSPDALAIHPADGRSLARSRRPVSAQARRQFGLLVACGRVLPASSYKAMDRAVRKDAFHAIVAAGPPPGLLAYDGDRAVGWCAVGPRVSLARFQGAKTSRPIEELGGPAMSPIYAISCFFVRTGLSQARADAASRGGRHRTRADEGRRRHRCLRHRAAQEADLGRRASSSSASVFSSLGFQEIARRSAARPLMLGRPRAAMMDRP